MQAGGSRGAAREKCARAAQFWRTRARPLSTGITLRDALPCAAGLGHASRASEGVHLGLYNCFGVERLRRIALALLKGVGVSEARVRWH